MNKDDALRELGARVKIARVEANLSQSELAKRTRLSRTAITNIECGRQNTTVWTLLRIANSCNIPPHELLAPVQLWTATFEVERYYPRKSRKT